ncbi:MAG: hypothetical protein AAF639_23420 [Chloroflexota bacterium]
MTTYPEIEETRLLFAKQTELEAKIKELRTEIEQNHLTLIQAFFPYLLPIYEKWRPHIGEVAVLVNFEHSYCHDVIVREINGYRVRAQEGDKSMYHRFELNPDLDGYIKPVFILPKQNFDEIKASFELHYYSV